MKKCNNVRKNMLIKNKYDYIAMIEKFNVIEYGDTNLAWYDY